MTTLLFVHGTGVRETAFDATLAAIKRQAARTLGAGVEVQGCEWGRERGVQPPKLLTSVPGYAAKQGGKPAPRGDAVAETRWSLLYDDPLYELRTYATLAALAADDDGLGGSDRSGREPAPSLQVIEPLRDLLPSQGGIARAGHLAVDLVAPALRAMQAEGILAQALKAPALADIARSRPVLGRAFVAAWTKAAAQRDLPPLDGELRDSLYRDAVQQLGGAPKGLKDDLLSCVLGLASHLSTPYLRGHRGAVSDAHLAATNDVMLYQTAHGGDGIRNFIAQRIRGLAEAGKGPVYLLAHSLGGIASVELLSRQAHGVAGLITCGSQAPFLVESDALAVLRRGDPLPPDFPKWLNVYDRNDMLSYEAAGVYPGRVTDLEVASRQPFPDSHGAYWTQAALWAAIKDFIAGPSLGSQASAVA